MKFAATLKNRTLRTDQGKYPAFLKRERGLKPNFVHRSGANSNPRDPCSVARTLQIMQTLARASKCFDFQIDALARRAFGTGSDLQDVVHQKVR